MDDSTQSKLCSDTNHPPSVITPLTLFIKLPTWPLGNLNHSPPPSQPRWVLRFKSFGGSFVKFLWAAFSASLGMVTRNICLHLNLCGFPVWSLSTRALQADAVLLVMPTFPNGGMDWPSQASIVMIYTAPVATFCCCCCFPGFVVVTWLLEAPVLPVLGTTGITGLFLEFDWRGGIPPVCVDVLWPLLCSFFLVLLLTFLSRRSSTGSNHSEESAPVLLKTKVRIFCSWQILVLPNLRRVGFFQISTMANLEIRFQAPLTRPGIKLDKIKRKGGGGRDKKNHTWPESTLWRRPIEQLLTVQQWRKTKSFNGWRNETSNLESPRTKIKLRLLLNLQQPAVTEDHQGYTVNSLIATTSRKRPPPVSDYFTNNPFISQSNTVSKTLS